MTNPGDSDSRNEEDAAPDDEHPETDGTLESAQREPKEQGSAEPAARSPWYRRMSRGRKLLLPVLTVAFLLVIVISFHAILLPFIFACVIVYLMEPVVRRLSPRLPRWAAVILVYVTFFGIITTSAFFVVPRFVTEIVRFAETVPDAVAEFREENLPGINERVQSWLEKYLPAQAEPPDFEPAKRRVHEAWQDATSRAAATAVARARGRAASDLDVKVELDGEDGQLERTYEISPRTPEALAADWEAQHGRWSRVGTTEKPVVRLVPGDDGSYEVYLNEGEVEVSQLDQNVWSVRRSAPVGADAAAGHEGFEVRSLVDLEARVNELVESAISTSQERITSLIGWAQTLVVGIIQVLVAVILTFMVAAFISIDLPSFMGFFRDMVPRDYRSGYDELLSRIDRGVSGVIRGQLMICLVNGILTYIGLVLLDIKFSVLLAVVAGVLSLIPIFGTVISTIPIVIIGLMNGFITGLLALIWILGIHAIEANILNPQIIGTSAHIHPVIVIFALLAGESAFGLVGALLAVPVASILLEVFKFMRDKIWGGEEDGEAGGAAAPSP